MQEVFENIIEKLDKASDYYECEEQGREHVQMVDLTDAIEIVKQEAEKYVSDNNVGNNGWIPCSEPPKDDNYVLLSFENFSLPIVGRYEADGEGGGTYYLGDCDEEDTCIANDLFVNAWQTLPPRYNPDREKKEKKTKYDQIRSMTVEELAEFLCKVKADYQWLEHEFPSEEDCGIWEEWLQSEVESEKND